LPIRVRSIAIKGGPLPLDQSWHATSSSWRS